MIDQPGTAVAGRIRRVLARIGRNSSRGMQLRQQEIRLLNLRLLDEINGDMYGRESTELRDRIAELSLKVEATDRNRIEQAELAIKVFELSQALEEKWFDADYAAKRQMLEMVFLNLKLDDVSLCYEMRRPFDVLA
jgi:site-specific DNA recombinase